MTFAMSGICLPSFVLGPLLILLFSAGLGCDNSYLSLPCQCHTGLLLSQHTAAKAAKERGVKMNWVMMDGVNPLDIQSYRGKGLDASR